MCVCARSIRIQIFILFYWVKPCSPIDSQPVDCGRVHCILLFHYYREWVIIFVLRSARATSTRENEKRFDRRMGFMLQTSAECRRMWRKRAESVVICICHWSSRALPFIFIDEASGCRWKPHNWQNIFAIFCAHRWLWGKLTEISLFTYAHIYNALRDGFST